MQTARHANLENISRSPFFKLKPVRNTKLGVFKILYQNKNLSKKFVNNSHGPAYLRIKLQNMGCKL